MKASFRRHVIEDPSSYCVTRDLATASAVVPNGQGDGLSLMQLDFKFYLEYIVPKIGSSSKRVKYKQ